MGDRAFLGALAVVLCTAGLTTVLCRKLRQPVVLGYILAGLIVGPHVPIPLVADRSVVQTLSEVGVILLMFSLGLEFSLRKLVRVGPTAGVTATIQTSILVWLGYMTGQMLGWTQRDSLFCGAIIAISSTTIIAKAFDEQGVTGKLRELVVGVLIVEDLIAILLMAILTAVASGSELTASTLAMSGGRLALFLVGLVAVGLLFVPRTIRAIVRLERPETTLVASIGICFAISLLALRFGYSVALGAFLTGSGVRTSVRAGMSLAQIGEFSFIIAGVGIASGAIEEFLYPIAVAISAVTTLTTPWLIRASGPVASFVDHKLPQSLQTFASLYGSWIEKMRTAPRPDTVTARARRMARWLLVDAALVAAAIIGTALGTDAIASYLVRTLDLSLEIARAAVIAAAVLVALPFAFGVFRLAGALGAMLAEIALPLARQGRIDLSAAPRRALVVTLQLAVVLLVALPLLAITQPFLPQLPLLAAILVLIGVLVPAFWRSTASLQGHVKAGAELIVAALAARTQEGPPGDRGAFAPIQDLLPGLGEPEPFRIDATSPAIGKTLAELDLRGLTGASVLAIRRGGSGMLVPSAREVIREGDVLALAGTTEAVAAARELLGGGPG